MSLFVATLLPALLLLALGGLLLWNGPAVGATAKALPRSRRAAWLFMGVGALWFLWRLVHLGAADELLPKPILLLAFGAIALLSFSHAPDFLAVRGLAIVTLLAAGEFLYAAYMELAFPQRRLMVAAVYVAIVAAIFLGAYPYRLRDFFGWLFARPGRPRALGALLAGYGLVLTIVALTY
ncbi:MAG: hypothetical protein QM691_13260 [Opitutaceae bacterium]